MNGFNMIPEVVHIQELDAIFDPLGKATPVEFDAKSGVLDLGDGATLTLTGGDLSVAGSEVLVDGQNLGVK